MSTAKNLLDAWQAGDHQTAVALAIHLVAPELPVEAGVAEAVAPKDLRLSPWWTEWLMGWPIGWTEAEPLEAWKMLAWMERMRGGWWTGDPAVVPWHGGQVVARMLPKTDISHRSARGRTIGNGQVPRTTAIAVMLLTRYNGGE